MSKYIAPVVSALVVIALAVGYAAFIFLVINKIDVGGVIKVIIAVLTAGAVIGISAALISRIKELRGGQEDDLGKY